MKPAFYFFTLDVNIETNPTADVEPLNCYTDMVDHDKTVNFIECDYTKFLKCVGTGQDGLSNL